MNVRDTEHIIAELQSKENYTPTLNHKEADLIIVNTCGFLEAAKEESLNTVLTLHNHRKDDSLLVMAGCLSERYKEILPKEIPEVDIWSGVADFDKIDEMVKDHMENPENREWQKTLAYKVVEIIHGEKEATLAVKISDFMFQANDQLEILKTLTDEE